MVERRFNSIATIIDPPPYDITDHDRPCPARIRFDGDDRVQGCDLVIRAGRTKHRNVHHWVVIET